MVGLNAGLTFSPPVSVRLFKIKPCAAYRHERGVLCSLSTKDVPENAALNRDERHVRRGILSWLSVQFLAFKNELRELEKNSRPGLEVESISDMKSRYNSLPESVKGPNQMLGRMSPGCEGTHGVFPKCNFRCQPCYHSEDANSVRVDGFHTVSTVAKQMRFLQRERGPVAHCQLIGGEVSLLSPEDHAQALEVMRFYGRLPMSFTHGDFSYEYLKALALSPKGKPRFQRLDFAVHFDMYMYGRKGIPRPESEAALHSYRVRFIDMFKRLRREHGVHFYLAHNMTVQPGNFDQIADVVHEIRQYGFRLLSFQPAAQQGAHRRRVPRLSDDGDALWAEIERGAGVSLPYNLFQMGDPRCNRVAFCALVGKGLRARVVPFFDSSSAGDKRLRDVLMTRFGSIALPHTLIWLKGLRLLIRRPWLLALLGAWVFRFIRRCGNVGDLIRGHFSPITFVMHRFMDADDVRVAWALMEAGFNEDSSQVSAAGARIQETVERLRSCAYGMAQVEQHRVVPACVQHSVYDGAENRALAKILTL